MVDNLNLLYVAFTRASKSLYVIGRRNAKNTRSILIEQVLPLITDTLSATTLDGLDTESAPLTFTYGTNPPLSTLNSTLSTIPSPNPFLQSPTLLPVKIATYKNQVEFRQSNRSKAFIEGEDERSGTDYLKMGSILHEIFSTIRTTADIPTVLKRLEQEGVLYDNQHTADKIITMLKKRLEHPKVAEWFSDRWTLFNECTILSQENGTLKIRRPDRVMTDDTNWVVVDFKFAAPKPSHESQVREYMTLLSAMGHQHITGYLWYVYTNQIKTVNCPLSTVH